MKMKIIITIPLLAILLTSGFALAGAEKGCNVLTCDAGDKAITYATKSDFYYACPSRELTDYTNFILGLVSASVTLTGKMPNISDKTGEPEYLDTNGKPNETRLMVEMFRKRAGVNTFDQATSQCNLGESKLKVTVMNNPKDSTSMWVMADKSKKTFWMPKSHLDKK